MGISARAGREIFESRHSVDSCKRQAGIKFSMFELARPTLTN